jgi:DNA anti-recombination protein RmuC
MTSTMDHAFLFTPVENLFQLIHFTNLTCQKSFLQKPQVNNVGSSDPLKHFHTDDHISA